jgi:hypothetical protein
VGQVVNAHDYDGPTIFEIQPVFPTGSGGVFTGDAGPIYLHNSAFRHGKQEHDFSPLVEFRTGLNYHVTQAFALTLGFNATFIDNVRRASPSVAYVLPNMGFRDSGTQEIFTAGVNFGVEFNR